MKRSSRVLSAWIAAVILSTAAPRPAAADTGMDSNAFTKLLRGAVNVVTGWVEIPKKISQTSSAEGAGAGWTKGLLRGFGYGFVRTVAGAYEIVTFPFPAPAGYEPVMRPEFVFDSDEPDDSADR